MVDVRLERRIDVPTGLSFHALGEVLSGIARAEKPWIGFALHVDLADAGLPDVGFVAVPVTLELGTQTPGINQYNITVHAARHPEAFPVFTGSFGADMAGQSASMLWLSGKYSVPLGPVGSLMNASLGRDVAHRSLENLLSDVANATLARVEHRESEFMRYSLFQHGP
jgi:hypothetical protein